MSDGWPDADGHAGGPGMRSVNNKMETPVVLPNRSPW